MVSFVCVMKSGGDYSIDDAVALSRQVMRNMHIPHRFICLSDIPIYDSYVDYFPLTRNLPGWWSLIESFKITGPVIVTGLDTLIINSIDRLAELALTCPNDVFYMARPQPRALSRGEKMCSGIMMWNGDWSWLYDDFQSEYMHRFIKEQRYTSWKLKTHCVKVRLVQDYFDGFYSYKNDCLIELPKDAKIIGFHGKPRPKECKEQWVMNILQDKTLPIHGLASLKVL